jgi:hypothetical protein
VTYSKLMMKMYCRGTNELVSDTMKDGAHVRNVLNIVQDATGYFLEIVDVTDLVIAGGLNRMHAVAKAGLIDRSYTALSLIQGEVLAIMRYIDGVV